MKIIVDAEMVPPWNRIVGTVTSPNRIQSPFDGWLDLIRVIEDLCAPLSEEEFIA